MKATLTIHIGCAKGGSSALQRFLRLNVDRLRAQGIVVPTADLRPDGTMLGHQLDLFQQRVRGGRAEPIPDLEEQLLALVADGDGPPVTQIVLSAENLCNPVGFEQLFVGLRRSFDVRMLMYVRRQDDYLESAWQQWYVKEGRSLLAWLVANVGIVADWSAYLAPWVDAFGAEALTVRRFDRSSLVGGDIVTDFCDYASVDLDSVFVPPAAANPSFDNRVSRLAEGRPRFFEGSHDHSFYDMLGDLTRGAVLKQPSSPRLLTPDERRSVLARYEASNEALRAQFFPDQPAPLFDPPDGDDEDRATDLSRYERELLQLQIQSLYSRVVDLERSLQAQGDAVPDA